MVYPKLSASYVVSDEPFFNVPFVDNLRLRAAWGGYPGYDGFFQRPLNNAHLASVATYHDCVPGLRLELERAGSIEQFYERAEELAAEAEFDVTIVNREVHAAAEELVAFMVPSPTDS